MVFPICLSVYGDTKSVLEALQKQDADLFEIRLDLSQKLDFHAIRDATTKPLIFASHTKPELLEDAIGFANYLDVGSYTLGTKQSQEKTITSFHGAEEDPIIIWEKLHKDSITKIILETADYKRISQLLELNQRDPAKAICFAMGEIGAFSRILSVFYGAPWIYASLTGQPTATGQYTIDELLNLYRVKRFSTTPSLFGILGNPVAHSLSPEFHNRKFAQNDLPWIYLRFPCTDLNSLMSHAEIFEIQGFSVTHPFKEQIIHYLNSKSNEVELLRSCNTVYRKDKEWHGTNTDVIGFEELLLKNNLNLHDLRVAIIGAGGAARAAAYIALRHGAHLIFLNRTFSKAETLAAVFNGEATSISEFSSVEYDVLIQTTPIGMQNDESPVNPDALRPRTTVIDVIYEPNETLLLKKARALGCRTINGQQWFDSQAQAQFEWWMGLDNAEEQRGRGAEEL
jgi:3-dehydroquinate dehydratase/shikimate dehydrogenase